MASYMDKGTVRFILLAALFAFMLQARPPQQEVGPYERPVGWFPGASRPSNRSTIADPEPAPTPSASPLLSSLGINSGEEEGTSFTAADGRVFVSDTPYLVDPQGVAQKADFSWNSSLYIEGTADQGLYLRERYGQIVYTFSGLENGMYDITFYEAEVFFDSPGQRVFAIYIDDVLTTMSSVDLVEMAGGNFIAADFSLRHNVVDSKMRISFQSLMDQAKVNAIWFERVRTETAPPVTEAPITKQEAVPAPAEVPTPVEGAAPAPTEEPVEEKAVEDTTVNETPVQPQYVTSIGVDCGSNSTEPYVDAEGRVFVNDEPYLLNGTWHQADFSKEEGFFIEGTNDQPLYLTERFGPLVYNFPGLENGVYWVTFYETEAWWKEEGQRVFDVYIDGDVSSQTGVDLFARSQDRQRVAVNFGVFHPVTDHQMSIEFGVVVDQPKINAIYIQKVRDLSTDAPAPVETESNPPENVPTAEPASGTPEPEVPTPVPEVPTLVPEVPTEAPTPHTEEEASAVDQTQALPPAPLFTPIPTEMPSSMPQWILKGLPISFYSTLACTAVAGPVAELFGYKTVIAIGAFARVLIQLGLLFDMPLTAAQVQYGVGAAADIILVAFLFLHVAERHFQLAVSVVLAASAIGVVGAAGTSQIMQFFMPDKLIQWLPLGSALFAAFLASILPQDPLRDELERTKAKSSRLPLRGFFGREGLVGELLAVFSNKPIWILSFWWVFASAVKASLLTYVPDLLTEISPSATWNKYALDIVHILSTFGALMAVKLAARVARTGGLAYFVGSLLVGLAAVGCLLVPRLGMAYTSLVVTAGAAQLLLCLVFAQSASLVSNGRFALLFGTNATLSLLVQGAMQLVLDNMGWHISDFFFMLGLASIAGAVIFGLLCALHRCTTGRVELVHTGDLAGDYNLIGGSHDRLRNAIPIYEIQDESAWKIEDPRDDSDGGDVEMLGLIEGRPGSGVVIKDEGSLNRI